MQCAVGRARIRHHGGKRLEILNVKRTKVFASFDASDSEFNAHARDITSRHGRLSLAERVSAPLHSKIICCPHQARNVVSEQEFPSSHS